MGWKDESNVNVNDQREKVSDLFPDILPDSQKEV